MKLKFLIIVISIAFLSCENEQDKISLTFNKCSSNISDITVAGNPILQNSESETISIQPSTVLVEWTYNYSTSSSQSHSKNNITYTFTSDDDKKTFSIEQSNIVQRDETPVLKEIIFTSDKESVSADGTDTVIFSVVGINQFGCEIEANDFSIIYNNTTLSNNSFVATQTGAYEFTAIVGTLESEPIRIEAADFDEYSYTVENFDVGGGQNIEISFENNLMAQSSMYHQLNIIDIASGNVLHTLNEKHPATYWYDDIALSKDGSTLYAFEGGYRKDSITIEAYNTSNGELAKTYKIYRKRDVQCSGIVDHANENLIFNVSDEVLIKYNMASSKIDTIVNQGYYFTDFVFNKAGDKLLVTSSTLVSLIDYPAGTSVLNLSDNTGDFRQAIFSTGETEILIALSHDVNIFNSDTGELTQSIHSKNGYGVSNIAIDNNGTVYMTHNTRGTIELYDSNTGILLASLFAPSPHDIIVQSNGLKIFVTGTNACQVYSKGTSK